MPQGSILGPSSLQYICCLWDPFFFILFFRKHNVLFHCFADDLQIHLPLKTNDRASVQVLLDCLSDILSGMEVNFLFLNKNKTDQLGQQNHLDCIDSAIGSLDSHCRPFARNLGVIIDSDFKFNKQISSTVKTTFFQLRQLAKVKSNLPRNDFARVIHTLVTLRLDNCNSLFIGLDQSALRQQHWLHVNFRIQF